MLAIDAMLATLAAAALLFWMRAPSQARRLHP
jgi:hypothetical protein